MHLIFFHLSSWLDSSFLFSTKKHPFVYTYHNSSIHLLKDILFASKFLVIMHKADIDIYMQTFVSNPLCKYQEVLLLNQMVRVYCQTGAPGWLSRLRFWLWLKWLSHSLWVQTPHRALCWLLRVWSLLWILSPLSLPLPCLCVCALSLSQK